MENGQAQEAILELRVASQLRPNDRDLTLRIAEMAARAGDTASAIEYYQDAHAQDPSDEKTVVAYAGVLADSDPEKAAALVETILQANPQQAYALLVRARLLMATGNVREARKLVERAQGLKPEDPEIEWMLAELLLVQSKNLRLLSASALKRQEPLNAILGAYDRYLEKGGTRRIDAALGRARGFEAWAWGTEEAQQAYVDAIALAKNQGTAMERNRAFTAAARYANRVGESRLEREALEALIETHAQEISAWKRLGFIRYQTEGAESAEELWQQMFDKLGQVPDTQVVYAEYIDRSRGRPAAIAYLKERIQAGDEVTALRAATFRLQIEEGRIRDSAKTLQRMRQLEPNSPATIFYLAQQQIVEHQIDEAAATLRSLLETSPSPEAWRLLAQVESERSNQDEALEAIEKAIALNTPAMPVDLGIKARVLIELGRARESALILRDLSERKQLSIDERLLMARGYYESRGELHGRRILEGMLEAPNPEPRAALALAHWELDNPHREEDVRKVLNLTHLRHPENVELVDLLIEGDLARGHNAAAVARVTRAIQRRPRAAGLYLARGRVWNTINRKKEAIADARQAVELDPNLRDEAYSLLVGIYSPTAHRAQAIADLIALQERGEASPDDLVLIGHLHLLNGNHAPARLFYELALREGSELIVLKNDLAYLLAVEGQDLDRALELAQLAVDDSDESIATADTLGFVYLQSGSPEAAYWQFRFVTEEADPPRPEYWYHLGLALMGLERLPEARGAFTEALRVAPQYQPALQQLEALPSPTEEAAQAS